MTQTRESKRTTKQARRAAAWVARELPLEDGGEGEDDQAYRWIHGAESDAEFMKAADARFAERRRFALVVAPLLTERGGKPTPNEMALIAATTSGAQTVDDLAVLLGRDGSGSAA